MQKLLLDTDTDVCLACKNGNMFSDFIVNMVNQLLFRVTSSTPFYDEPKFLVFTQCWFSCSPWYVLSAKVQMKASLMLH